MLSVFFDILNFRVPFAEGFRYSIKLANIVETENITDDL